VLSCQSQARHTAVDFRACLLVPPLLEQGIGQVVFWLLVSMSGQPSSGPQSGIDAGQWDADCEAAFEQALPTVWECCDRAHSSTSRWRELDSQACGQINALAARGLRQGIVTLKGRDGSFNEFEVNMQDPHRMWAKPKPTDQSSRCERKLRRLTRQPRTSKAALMLFYAQYMQALPPADHPAGPDGVQDDDLVQLFQDIGIVNPGSDVAALAFSAACKASKMGTIRRREFICGCAALGVDNLDELKALVPELRANAVSGVTRDEVYSHTFTSALDDSSKVMELPYAIAFWEVLLPKWELRDDYCEWAKKHMKRKAINRDTWNMVLKFATEVPADLSTYDENPAWPVDFDEFVEYYRASKGA